MSGDTARPLFPVFLDLGGRLCVVIGEGERAERKARALVEVGGDVVVVCSRPTETLLEACTAGELTVEQRGYVRGDLENAALVLCIGQSDEVARAVAAEARERNCLVNATGMPELCDFIIPSVVTRGDLQVALSTAGTAPAAARQARGAIEEALGNEWSGYVALLAGVRAHLIDRGTDAERASKLLARAASPAVLERLASGERIEPAALLAQLEADAPGEADSLGSAGAPREADPDTDAEAVSSTDPLADAEAPQEVAE